MLVKKRKFCPVIPDWEFNSGFDPECIVQRVKDEKWVNYRGENAQPSPCVTAEDVAKKNVKFDLENLRLRDPNNFIPGNLHSCLHEWEKIDAPDNVLEWLKEGVDVKKFFKPFKGNFKGKSYSSDVPPSVYFPNSTSCAQFKDYIVKTLYERLENGSLTLIGKVGFCEPPHLVLPLTVEPTKPRLCHDERFLNLWVKDCPFSLDTLKDVPRLVQRGMFMSSMDDKSGYDHIYLSEQSKKYFGLQFGGWFMIFNTLPFGFKASAFIYQSVGMVATSWCRSLGVPCLQYIDDRWIGGFLQSLFHDLEVSPNDSHLDDSQVAEKALYIVCQVMIRVGYFLNIKKSVLVPVKCIKFLGMLVDSERLAFIIPDEKIQKFIGLRESILDCDKTSVLTLQKFAGKCVSFMLAFPGAKLYTKEVNRAIGLAAKRSGFVDMTDDLRQEILYWRFIDHWSGCFSWRNEKHLQITVASDASKFKWGALVDVKGQQIVCADYWRNEDDRPIHVKEAQALFNALCSVKDVVKNHRVDAYVDNLACVYGWESMSGKDPALNRIMKSLWNFSVDNNMDLHLLYVKSEDNPADCHSRRLSALDCMLTREKFETIEKRFGPHSVDLMSLDSNCMISQVNGKPLRHFTPYPTPLSAGVNVFSQDITLEKNPYVFPPFRLILPLIVYLKNQGVEACTMVIPKLLPIPVWWPLVSQYAMDRFVLGKKGERGVLLFPSKSGFSEAKHGLLYDLIVVRLVLSK